MPMRSVRLIGPGNSDRDLLQIEVDEPSVSAQNCGVLTGVTRTTLGVTTITAPDQTFTNIDFTGRVSVQAARAKFYNCMFRGTAAAPASATNLVSCTNANVVDAYFQDCTFDPQTAGRHWRIGIEGHDFVLNRCHLIGSVDHVNVYKSGVGIGYQTNVQMLQTLFDEMGWWTASTGGVVHSTDTETHNDCVQHMGGGGTLMRGCAFYGRFKRQYGHWQVSNPSGPEPFTTVALNSLADGGPWQNIPRRNHTGTAIPTQPDGNDSTGAYNWDDDACLMIGNEVGYTFDLRVYGNWFYGGNFAINGGGNENPGAGVNLGEFYRNKFDRTQGNQDDEGPDGTHTINLQGAGWSASTADIPTVGANRNIYKDNGNNITVRY